MLKTIGEFMVKPGRPRKKLEDKLSGVLTTDKQKAFLRNRLAGMNKRQAAIQAGYAASTASIMATRLTDRLACNREFIEEMDRQGLTIRSIVGEVKRGMTKAVHPSHPDQPDNFNRRAYTDMAIRLYGGYAPAKIDVQKEQREESVMLEAKTICMIKKVTGEDIFKSDPSAVISSADDEGER